MRCQDDTEQGVPGGWDNWQIDEDLREARRVIGSHVEMQRKVAAGLMRTSDSLRTRIGPRSVLDQPPIDEPPLALPISAATSTMNSNRTNSTKTGQVNQRPGMWSGMAFCAAGFIGGTAAIVVAQNWPAWFLPVLCFELGLGVLSALLIGCRRTAESRIA